MLQISYLLALLECLHEVNELQWKVLPHAIIHWAYTCLLEGKL